MNVLASERSVDGREGVELVLEQVLLLRVEVAAVSTCFWTSRIEARPKPRFASLRPAARHSHSDELGTVLGNSCTLAGDLGGVDEVLEDLLVDGGEGSGSGSLLLRGGGRVSLRLGEDSALRQEDDVFVGQLLLELSGKPVGGSECE